MIARLQQFPLTAWLWQRWQHSQTGRIILVPIWEHPGRRWYRISRRKS